MQHRRIFHRRTFLRFLLLLFCTFSISGCVYWRLFQTKQQLNEFDRYFSIIIDNGFTWHFKEPLVYSDDFVFLSKFQPTLKLLLPQGYRWRYWFYKVDEKKQRTDPLVSYYFDLSFNREQRLTDWTLSELFLNIAPADFLEVSLRSIGRGDINESKRQLKVDVTAMQKTSAPLPLKQAVVAQLGVPLSISHQEKLEVYRYHFLLDTATIEEGYEDRALTVAELFFDAQQRLVKVQGRFVGVKLRIDYRKYMQEKEFNRLSGLYG